NSHPDAETSKCVVDIGANKFDEGLVSFYDQSLIANLDVVIDFLGKPIPFSEIFGSKEAQKALAKGAGPQEYAFGLAVKGQYHGP
ncbi:AsmA family protein, partial [Pseudomonas syringae pv. tagetis]